MYCDIQLAQIGSQKSLGNVWISQAELQVSIFSSYDLCHPG